VKRNFLCAIRYARGEECLALPKKAPKNVARSGAHGVEAVQKPCLGTMRDYANLVHGDMKATELSMLNERENYGIGSRRNVRESQINDAFEKPEQKIYQRFAKNWERTPSELALQVDKMLQRLKEDSDYFTKGS